MTLWKRFFCAALTLCLVLLLAAFPVSADARIGDLNADGAVDTDDAIQLLLFISMPDLYPLHCTADFNGSNTVDTDDAIQLLLHIAMPDQFLLYHDPNHTHSYTLLSDTATCTMDGTRTEVCNTCGHQKTTVTKAFGHTLKTETVAATCTNVGYIKEFCVTCKAVISNKTISATGKHNYTVQIMADISKEYLDKNDYRYAKYCNCTDWVVDRCADCGYFDLEKMRFRYNDYEAAMIMLKYVNDLRAEIYGTQDYDLVLDAELLRLSKIRAKEISTNFSHWGGTYTNAGENIIAVGYSIYDQFRGWKNSEGHYQNMIDKSYKYFGYAIYDDGEGTGYIAAYGVQLFWSQNAKDIY